MKRTWLGKMQYSLLVLLLRFCGSKSFSPYNIINGMTQYTQLSSLDYPIYKQIYIKLGSQINYLF